MMGISVWA